MGKLRGKKPETIEKRLKLFLYGEAGIGKTWAAIQFPCAYYIDTEKGSDFYADEMKKKNSLLFQSNNPDEIREELLTLLTTKHSYRTLIIDPVTVVYHALQEKWTRIFEKHSKTEKEGEIQDFGMRYWGKVKGEFKSLQRILTKLDMNVIVTAHQKDVYGSGFNKVGTTFDSMRGDDHFFDLIFHLTKKGESRISTTIKERAIPKKQKFPEEFSWSYQNFLKYYGKDIIEKESTPLVMATEDDVSTLEGLVKMVRIDPAQVNRWLTKADASSFAEFTKEQIDGCIAFVKKQISTDKGD